MKFLYKDSSLISDNQIKVTSQSLDSYITHIEEVSKKNNYDDPESTINLPSDTELLQKVTELKNKVVTPKLKYIIDIGIGGSNLGTKAVYDAFYGFFDILQPERFPKMIFADTNDPEFLFHLSQFIEKNISEPEEIIVNAISKSGGTTETIANLEIIFESLSKKFSDAKNRLVITTDYGSKLEEQTVKNDVSFLSMPKSVGGRYSVLSAVGLFPLACLGLDINELRDGALQMRKLCVSHDFEKNPALISAVLLFMQKNNGKIINDNFIFHSELESLGKWYRQLMGESIGKEGKGITPTVSIGSTDLHSVGQLYFGGPQDKMTTFISVEKSLFDVTVPVTLQYPLVQHIEGKKASDIMRAILEGVKVAYKNQQMPYTEVILDDISEKSIGEFMQFKMIEMMYLGKLLNVNSFDQPHVELYKTETKKILSQ